MKFIDQLTILLYNAGLKQRFKMTRFLFSDFRAHLPLHVLPFFLTSLTYFRIALTQKYARPQRRII